MTKKTLSTISLVTILALSAATAHAAGEQCAPGFKWDKKDNKCTCDERR